MLCSALVTFAVIAASLPAFFLFFIQIGVCAIWCSVAPTKDQRLIAYVVSGLFGVIGMWQLCEVLLAGSRSLLRY